MFRAVFSFRSRAVEKQRSRKELLMKALCVNKNAPRRARSIERLKQRIARLAEETMSQERARDLAVERLVNAREHAQAPESRHLVGRFRLGSEYSRLALLRAARAAYALGTM